MILSDREKCRLIEDSRDFHIESELNRLFPFLMAKSRLPAGSAKRRKSKKKLTKKQFDKIARKINEVFVAAGTAEMEKFNREHNIYMQKSRESAGRAGVGCNCSDWHHHVKLPGFPGDIKGPGH